MMIYTRRMIATRTMAAIAIPKAEEGRKVKGEK
jgi:hypothetical protein